MQANVRLKWHGSRFLRAYERGIKRNLDLAAKYGRDSVRADISTPGSYVPPVHSQPGNPPYRITGDVWRSYGYAVTGFPTPKLVVGSSDPVARYLELGTGVHGPFAPGHNTVHMLPRPHLRRLIHVRGHILARLICAPI